jgi:isoleucyl-tRNA synthetase
MNADKLAAYQTLQKCLETVALLAAPIAPFFCDNLFCDLNEVSQRYSAKSVHLADFPKYDNSLINNSLEEKMNLAQLVCSMVLALRRKANKKVRQPLTKILIPVLDINTKNNLEAVKHLILNEVNVKEMEFLDDTTGIIVKKIKPNFKTLGKVYGKQMKEISTALAAFSQQDINNLERQAAQTLKLTSGDVNITVEDVEITSEDIPGWLVATEGKLTIALDITITPELFDEGIAREIVNRIQNIRKNSNFDVTDKINIQIEKNEIIEKAVNAFYDYITSQTLAANISFADNIANGIDMELDEIVVKANVEKIH